MTPRRISTFSPVGPFDDCPEWLRPVLLSIPNWGKITGIWKQMEGV